MAPQCRADRMRSWYAASLVTRYHTWSTIQKETVGQHSHGVGIIYARYFSRLAADAYESYCAMRYILEHDLEELWTGDLPFPVKLRYPEIKPALERATADARTAVGCADFPQMSRQTHRAVKICDLLQMYLFGRHEVAMGNKFAVPIVHDTLTAAVEQAARDANLLAAVQQFEEDNRD